MRPLVWGVVVIAAVCLLQVPLTHYLSRYFEQDREDDLDLDPEPAADLPARTEAYGRDPGTCPRCGTVNDDGFDYCADCLAPLFRMER